MEVGVMGEEKFVIVYKKASEVERDAESLRNEIAVREWVGKYGKKGEGLSDKVLMYVVDVVELIVVGMVKWDLWSVEETIADMRKVREKTDVWVEIFLIINCYDVLGLFIVYFLCFLFYCWCVCVFWFVWWMREFSRLNLVIFERCVARF